MQHRILQLDGVRGLAIILVILHNQSGIYPSTGLDRVFANGWMGVDLFFVLSGFLITGILLDTRNSPGYFKNFYSRRCLRIWPLYYALLVFMFVIVPYVHPSEAAAIFERSSPWWAYVLFLQNFLVPEAATAAGPLGVTWSLAVEEQFYLIWPLVIRFCTTSQVRRLAIVAIAVSPVLRLILEPFGVDLYTNLFTRLDGLMAGALLAILVRSPDFVPSKYVGRAWAVLGITIPLSFLLETANARWIVYSFVAAAAAALVYLALYSSRKWLNTALTHPFIVYTGTISYGLYLLHKIPFDVALAYQFGLTLWAAPLLLVACYGMAFLSWNVLEQPFLKLKRFFEFDLKLRPPTAQ